MTDPIANTGREEARAKVNLFLRVLRRRPDGYHELETLIVPLELADELDVHADAGADFNTLALSLEVTGDPDLVHGVPVDGSNLVMRAAHALAEAVGARGFADISLHKRVPPAAGLGGGSADAAATLRALNDLWRCELEDRALGQVGAKVGSDVPALLVRGPVLARGRGERVEAFPASRLNVAVVTFPFGVSTADVYRWWDEDGGRTGPDPGPTLSAAAEGPPEALARFLYNDLEGPVTRRLPVIKEAKERLLEAGALAVVMCGSGPSLAALLPSEGRFEAPEGLQTRLVRTVGGT
jgi:4-diphosphocytidyl-2-C-methyl-D-erythritol kinase